MNAQIGIAHVRAERASVWFVIFPAAAMLLVWPIVADLPPLRIPSNFNWLQVALVSPWYLGLLSAPGYLYAWSGRYSAATASAVSRRWVTASLWGGVLASVGGFTTLLAIIPFPAVVGSLVASVILLWRHRGVRVMSPS